MMDHSRRFFLLLIVLSQTLVTASGQYQDFIGLKALECKNLPPNWQGSDPCEKAWDGIDCTNKRVTAIKLSSSKLTGQLSGDIDQLAELQTLDLSYNPDLTGPLPVSIGNLKKLSNLILVGCGFTGQIPDSIGSLQELVFLSLNSNHFSGVIPRSLGNLSKLYWLDIADNSIEGPIPVSDGTELGLDMLHHCKHFHLGKNKLTGSIPDKLFSSEMNLLHVLFDLNELTGGIPMTLGLVQTLEVISLNGNKLTNDIPKNLNNLTRVSELILSNNKLTGNIPNLANLSSLSLLDLSNNSFDSTDFPLWIPTLQSLRTLAMEDTQIQGQVPTELFTLSNLETAVLKKNSLNGTLDIGTSYGNHLKLIDMRGNLITKVENQETSINIVLTDNPLCQETTGKMAPSFCNAVVSQLNSEPYSTERNHCSDATCEMNMILSPNCKCAYAYQGTLYFRSPSFSDLSNTTYFKMLESSLMTFFGTHAPPVDVVSLSNPFRDASNYLEISLEIFPLNRIYFTRKELFILGFTFSNQTYKPPKDYGPYYFKFQEYQGYMDTPEQGKAVKTSLVVIIGAIAGGFAIVVCLVLAGIYVYRKKKRAKRAAEMSNPFVRWDTKGKNSGTAPQLKGSKWFSFEDLKKYTNNFSSTNDIGSGGYGKVYLGTLPDGELVAIKRAQRESMQGGVEFKNEIELLSRVHHKNLVSLVGFCFDKGEQILIYEYVPNGSLKDSLTGKSGIILDWAKRLKAALGTAKGLAYLHEHANPPIIHRDVKSTNVLLDDRLTAKVGDFGLSKLMGDGEKDHVTTQVKGTMGYLDPEYYMSQQLTEKSDVYSFGILMLELLTAKKPIERGKYVVKEVLTLMDKSKELYNLGALLDKNIGVGMRLYGFESYVELAMRCVADAGSDRPRMSEVVKEIESIMKEAGLNPKGDSISQSYEESHKRSPSHPYKEELSFDHSASFPSSKIDPQ